MPDTTNSGHPRDTTEAERRVAAQQLRSAAYDFVEMARRAGERGRHRRAALRSLSAETVGDDPSVVPVGGGGGGQGQDAAEQQGVRQKG